MSCTTEVELNIGGPATLNVTGARRGSPWRLRMTFSDDVDLSTVTGVVAVVKRLPGDDVDPVLTFDVDLSLKADGVVLLEAEADDTVDVDAGTYWWEMELEASGDLDGWAPLRGLFPVMERIAVPESGS